MNIILSNFSGKIGKIQKCSVSEKYFKLIIVVSSYFSVKRFLFNTINFYEY